MPSEDVLGGLLAAAAPDALLAVDPGGTIVFVNDQAERLFGWSRADLVGQQVERLVPERFATIHPHRRAGYAAQPSTRAMGAGLKVWARRRDGSEFRVEISLSGFTMGERMVIAAVRDVSDRIELEAVRRGEVLDQQREQSRRLASLGQLAGGVAHDFNNLLGVMMNYTTLAARRVDDPTALSDLGEIRAAAERAAGLTRQLLTFASRDVANPGPLEVNGVVRSLAPMFHRTLGEHIDLHLDLADGQLTAHADRQQLEQLVVNLVINARDAMPDGGVVTIVTRAAAAPAPPGADVVLSVTDAGCGMSPEVAARAFEPFFTTKPTGEGTGLGLATVYGIVQQSGGEITIDSTLGDGTTVTVLLRGAEPIDLADALEEVTQPGGGHERILLAEDELALRAGIVRMLAGRGYEVVVAGDGVEALEIFEGDNVGFDLVLTDLAMPRMRGDELAVRLAERDPDLKVVFMSGYAWGDVASAGRLLSKPVAEDALLRMIREVLDE